MVAAFPNSGVGIGATPQLFNRGQEQKRLKTVIGITLASNPA
jgi:hypothetical protein